MLLAKAAADQILLALLNKKCFCFQILLFIHVNCCERVVTGVSTRSPLDSRSTLPLVACHWQKLKKLKLKKVLHMNNVS
jgi:hypothetical protein